MTIDCNIYESSLKNKYKSKIRINGSREEETLSLSQICATKSKKKKKNKKGQLWRWIRYEDTRRDAREGSNRFENRR